MLNKRMVSVFLCFLLSCGLAIGIIRNITLQTILDESWYDNIRSQIYFIDRIKDNINQEMINVTKFHDKSIEVSWKRISAHDIQDYFDIQLNRFISHLKNNDDPLLMDLTEISKQKVNNLVSQSMIVINPPTHQLNEDELIELEELKNYMIECISPYVMQDHDDDGIIDYITKLFLFLSNFTKDYIFVIMMTLIIGSLSLLLLYHYVNKLSFISIINLVSFMTGVLLIITNLLNNSTYIKPSSLTLFEEFSLAAAIDVSKKTMFLGKQLLIVSLIVTLVYLIVKEYRQIRMYLKKGTN